MLATAPALHNRIANHFTAAPKPVPESPDGKQAAWGEAVLAAAMFYQARLAHPDADAAERAAKAIFELEKTRLRHGREVAGTTVEKHRDAATPALVPVPDLPPIEQTFPRAAARPEPEESADDAKDRAKAEAIARTDGFAKLVGRFHAGLAEKGIDGDDAEELAHEFAMRMVRERIRERRRTGPPGGVPTRHE